jgi:hypothetical protein
MSQATTSTAEADQIATHACLRLASGRRRRMLQARAGTSWFRRHDEYEQNVSRSGKAAARILQAGRPLGPGPDQHEGRAAYGQ